MSELWCSKNRCAKDEGDQRRKREDTYSDKEVVLSPSTILSEEVDTNKEVVYAPSNILLESEKEAVPAPPSIFSMCPKFRILIIGGTGVGKSTICSLVFGIEGEKIMEVGVSHTSRGEHTIDAGLTFPGQNEKIIIHDSKGFEGGEQDTYDEVVDFINKKRSTPNLADQIRCIWYCISCENEARPLQQSEENFFGNLDALVGQIPVIVVFTKYDKMINKVYAEWMAKNRKQLARGEILEEVMFKEIRESAHAKYEKIYLEQWKRVLNGKHVPYLRIANPSIEDENNDLLEIYPEVGVEPLTIMTLQNLEDHNLKILWSTAQNNSADLTSKQSVAAGMEYFTLNMALNVVPFIPIVSGVTFWRVFTSCFSKISPLWNLIDDSNLLFKNSTRRQFIQAIFSTGTWRFLALQAFDVTGLLNFGVFNAPATASHLAKAIAGIILIHDSLFVMQKEQWRDNKHILSLTADQINTVLKDFHTSKLREVMITSITSSTLFTKCYSKDRISELISNTIDLARSKHPRMSLTESAHV